MKSETLLEGTGECIHRVVRVRIDEEGRQAEEQDVKKEELHKAWDGSIQAVARVAGLGKYNSKALKGWKIKDPNGMRKETYKMSGNSGVSWVSQDGVELPEDSFSELESRMMALNVNVGQFMIAK
jgi:hypothetical protein